MTDPSSNPAGPWTASGVRPQSLMLTFLAMYVRGRPGPVYSGSMIEIFGHLGISEPAVRSILARMVKRGLLHRHRRGRKAYYALTGRITAALAEGDRRVWGPVADDQWDGTWTLVAFTFPESWGSQRRDLRSRLTWGGFGMLHSGLWIAPGLADVPALLAGLELDDYVNVFSSRTEKPTKEEDMVGAAFDLPAIAGRYREFVQRWQTGDPLPAAKDDLARQLVLHTDWLHVVRADPRLPARHLPGDWPAYQALTVFLQRNSEYAERASALADKIIEMMDPPPPGDQLRPRSAGHVEH